MNYSGLPAVSAGWKANLVIEKLSVFSFQPPEKAESIQLS